MVKQDFYGPHGIRSTGRRKQPVGSADAYALGAKVSHNDKHWISTYDNNTWEPGVFGWDEAE